MLKKLYYFQSKHLSSKCKTILKSIESGLFTGLRNKDGSIKKKYINHFINNIKKYNMLLNEIKNINKLFFKLYPEYINTEIILYRGLEAQVNKDFKEYTDLIPTSFSYNYNSAMNFVTENGTLLKYICNNINIKYNMILNFTDDDLNEYEVILPDNTYKIKNINNKKYFYLYNKIRDKFCYNEVLL